MSEEEYVSASPREIHLYVSRLRVRDEKQQWQTAQLLSMLANVNSTEESRQTAGMPNGWSPEDFMPRKAAKKAEKRGQSLDQWALEMERNGYVDAPRTEQEKEIERMKAEEFKKQFSSLFKHKAGEVQLIPDK